MRLPHRRSQQPKHSYPTEPAWILLPALADMRRVHSVSGSLVCRVSAACCPRPQDARCSRLRPRPRAARQAIMLASMMFLSDDFQTMEDCLSQRDEQSAGYLLQNFQANGSAFTVVVGGGVENWQAAPRTVASDREAWPGERDWQFQPPPPPPSQQPQPFHNQQRQHAGQDNTLTLPPLNSSRADGHSSAQHTALGGGHADVGRMALHSQSLHAMTAAASAGKRKLRRGPNGKFEAKSNIHARKQGRFANAHGISQHSLTEQAIRPLMRFCQDTAAEYLKVSTNTLGKACTRLNIKWPRRPEVPTTVRVYCQCSTEGPGGVMLMREAASCSRRAVTLEASFCRSGRGC